MIKLSKSLTGLALAGSMLLGATAALADGMPRYGSIKDAPYVAPFSWTGFYAGIQGGYGWTGTSTAGILDPFNALGPGAGAGQPGTFLFDPEAKGGMVGAHIGYNWQASNLVIGAEVDWSWTNINGSAGMSPIPYSTDLRPGTDVSANIDIKSLGSARARLGYATPSMLAYLTGGVAWASYDADSNIVCPVGPCGTGVHSPGGVSDTRVGWVIGAGTDFLIGMGGWMLGVEYLYYRFDGNDSSNTPVLNLATGAPVSFGTCPSNASPCIGHTNGDFDLHTVKARLSYKF
jgi:outer membrane immunogenic protein